MSRLPLIAALIATVVGSGATAQAQDDRTVTVSASTGTLGKVVPSGFVGLSFEMDALTNSAAGGFVPSISGDSGILSAYEALFELIGPGVIRFGGNSVDQETGWVQGTRSGSACPTIVYSSDLDPAFEFANTVGWQVLLALSMGSGSPTADASEASYVYTNYSSELAGFEIGNEPNLFLNPDGYRTSPYGVSNYITDWQNNFYSTIHTSVPHAVYTAGAVTQGGIATWTTGSAPTSIASSTMSTQIGILTQHLYPLLNPTGCPANDITTLLSSTLRTTEVSTYADALQGTGLPWRMSETNSMGAGGEAGASNTFASTLWGLDYMYLCFIHGAVGVNFHCGAGANYTSTPLDVSDGAITIKPLYFALLAFSQGAVAGSHNLTLTTDTNGANVVIYSVLNSSNQEVMTVINKDPTYTANLQIQPGTDPSTSATYTDANALLLVSPDGIAATTGILFGGEGVSPTTGAWTPQPPVALTWNGGLSAFTYSLAPQSAMVITFSN